MPVSKASSEVSRPKAVIDQWQHRVITTHSTSIPNLRRAGADRDQRGQAGASSARYTSVCSANSRASSTSIPRYRPVLQCAQQNLRDSVFEQVTRWLFFRLLVSQIDNGAEFLSRLHWILKAGNSHHAYIQPKAPKAAEVVSRCAHWMPVGVGGR